jgi:protein FRG1
MVKPLAFKGDKKVKKRKHRVDEEPSTTLTTTDHESAAQDSDEAWTHPSQPSDLVGPTLLLLPTKPVTCLASDANGNIFASRVENIQDDVPSTAEPHDVRQVWVATKIAGLKDGVVSFKGSHGSYLNCDGFGVLRAQREAIGREEGFEIRPVEDETGSFVLKTAASKTEQKEKGDRFLAAVATVTTDEEGEEKRISVSIRGDAEDREDASTNIHLRMQARFKPQVIKEQAKEKDAKISRRELVAAVGRELEDDEVKRLKRARKNGTYHEELLDVRVKGKHDKFAS